MDNKDQCIQQFMELTAVENEVAVFYLEMAKWDIQAAVASYYANDMDENDDHDNLDVSSDVNELVEESGVNNVNVLTSEPISKPKTQEKIVTLSSLKHNIDTESDEERGQAFYVGGSERGGGQQVLGPPRVNKKAQNSARIQDLFKSAQNHGAEIAAEDYHDTGSSGSRKMFSGSGYRLGDENCEPAIPSGSRDTGKLASQSIKVNVKIWSNGFSVNDGQLRSLTEPNDVAFLRSLSTGQIPSELLQQHKFAKIDLNMEDRSSEEYKEPPKPKVVPFQGAGQMLGSPVPKVVSSSVRDSTDGVEMKSPVCVDETRPVTQLQIRLADNSRLVVRMNHDHTIGDVRAHIISQHPQYRGANFNLMTTFPSKVLSDSSMTLQDANLLNAVIVQRFV